jgi:lysophospholipase L1-like esterase
VRTLPLRRRILYTCVAAGAVLVLVECVLRIAGFERPTTIDSMAFTFPLDEFNREAAEPFLQRDDLLFWRPKPHVLGHNSRGVFGPEFAEPKDPRRYRIVTLGDSCTHLGPEPYPQRLQALLDQTAPGRFEVINAGVIGYTSFQGLTRLRHEVARWSPDLVTVYFGWNDHWLASGHADRDQRPSMAGSVGLRRAADHSRLYQLVAMLAQRARAPEARTQYRVSLEDYAQNLREMKRETDAIGASLWLITAPHALDLGVPPYLVSSGEVADAAGLVSLHDRYNDVVRAVAGDTGAPLIDLDRLFAAMNKPLLFLDDHIHLSGDGRSVAALALLATLKEQGIVAGTPK